MPPIPPSSGDQAKINALLAEGVKLTNQMGESISQTTTSKFNVSLEEAYKQIKLIRAEWDTYKKDIAGTVGTFQAIVKEVSTMNQGTKMATSIFTKLTGLASKLQYHQEGITKLSSKELKSLKEKAAQQTVQLQHAAAALVIELAQADAEYKRMDAAGEKTESQFEKIAKIKILQGEVTNEITDGGVALKKLNIQLDEQIKKQKVIEARLGITGGLLKGLSAIPILGPLLKTEKALEAATKAAEDGSSALGVMGAAAKSMGGSLLSSLTDPLVVVGFLVKAFKFFLEYALKADQNITDLGKSLGVSNEEATKLYTHFGEIQNSTIKVGNSANDLLKTQQNQFEAQLQIADALGATKGITDKQIDSQIYLNKQLKLSAEAQKGMIELGSLNNMEAIDMVKLIVKQTGALSKQTGIQLNNKKVIEQVSKLSGQLSANYKNDPALIAKAVVQANKLGLTLEGAANASSKLLDFESSIQNELEAELLTGKDLNLEKARLLALNGDAAGAAAEMLAQVGSLSEFQNMNVLQQEALAKAVGMTANELANSLRQQENLNNLGDENKKQIEEAAEALRMKGDIIGANALLNQTANDDEAVAALGKLSEQEKFNAAVEKLKATLGAMMSEEMIGLVKHFVSLIDSTTKINAIIDKIKTGFEIIAVIIGVKMVAGLVASIAKALILLGIQGSTAAAAAATNASITFGLGTVAIIAGVAAVMGAVGGYALSDGHIGSDGGLIVSGEKGSYQLDKNDSVIAGTNLMGDGAVKSDGSKGSISFNSESIVVELQNVRSILNQILTKEGSVKMDSTQVGTSTNVGTYKVQ
jgi:hypothetical protein